MSFEDVTQPDEVTTFDRDKMTESLGIGDDLAQLEDAEYSGTETLEVSLRTTE